jgi:hypothetical protein
MLLKADISVTGNEVRFGPFPDSRTAQNGFLSDHLVGASVCGLIRAAPLSEDPQSTASRLIGRPGRSTQIL